MLFPCFLASLLSCFLLSFFAQLSSIVLILERAKILVLGSLIPIRSQDGGTINLIQRFPQPRHPAPAPRGRFSHAQYPPHMEDHSHKLRRCRPIHTPGCSVRIRSQWWNVILTSASCLRLGSTHTRMVPAAPRRDEILYLQTWVYSQFNAMTSRLDSPMVMINSRKPIF